VDLKDFSLNDEKRKDIYIYKAKLSPKAHSNIQKSKEKIAQTFLEC
jgi:hypothetical protein